jgi:glycosyltransferase involved in cell wall biosynthesis
MGYGNCVLTLATPENLEAVGNAGIPYADQMDLVEKLQRVLRDGSLVQAYRQRAQQRVRQYYDWDQVVDRYEQLFADMAGLRTSSVEFSASPEDTARLEEKITSTN